MDASVSFTYSPSLSRFFLVRLFSVDMKFFHELIPRFGESEINSWKRSSSKFFKTFVSVVQVLTEKKRARVKKYYKVLTKKECPCV